MTTTQLPLTPVERRDFFRAIERGIEKDPALEPALSNMRHAAARIKAGSLTRKQWGRCAVDLDIAVECHLGGVAHSAGQILAEIRDTIHDHGVPI